MIILSRFLNNTGHRLPSNASCIMLITSVSLRNAHALDSKAPSNGKFITFLGDLFHWLITLTAKNLHQIQCSCPEKVVAF